METPPSPGSRDAITGAILGTAVGDAIGLPYEGLSRRRAARLLGEPDRHRFFLRRGMVSDDTEHSCIVMQALIAAGDDEELFVKNLASRMRLWLLGLPAGIGRATLKATLKLWLGVSPRRSGVFSAGNGPAMRSAVLGAAIEDVTLLQRLVRASTRITHTDPKAEYGAMAVALAANMASRGTLADGAEYLTTLREILTCNEAGHDDANELLSLLEKTVDSVSRRESTRDFADSLGLSSGVSGYTYHTVPIAVHASLLKKDNPRGAIMDVVSCGGDADTTAAIVGGIVGAGVGPDGIPDDWLDGIYEWPRTVRWMQSLADQLAESRSEKSPTRPARLSFAGIAARNLVFTLAVFIHALRRLLPPY